MAVKRDARGLAFLPRLNEFGGVDPASLARREPVRAFVVEPPPVFTWSAAVSGRSGRIIRPEAGPLFGVADRICCLAGCPPADMIDCSDP